MNAEQFINQYGYWTIFLGAIIEGESIIIGCSAFCAKQGSINIFFVFLISFLTTVVFDQITFMIGRLLGLERVLSRMPKTKNVADKVFAMIEKNDTMLILLFRFIWGIRFVTPILIGASNVKYSKYTALNIIAAFLWALSLCGCGYLLGGWANRNGYDITKFASFIAVSFIVTSLFIGFILKCKRKTHGSKK